MAGGLLPDHGRTQETEHLIYRIRDRVRTAACEKQTDRTRISRYVLYHKRSRVAAVEKFASAISDDDLAGKRFRKCCAARAFVVVSDADGSVQT